LAIAFLALIHDVDHPGVSNLALVQKASPLVACYGTRCVTQQNSFDVAWKLFMKDDFKDLRAVIYRTQSELDHFRDLVVNMTMATDIMDNALGDDIDQQWREVFELNHQENTMESMNYKAKFILQHIIRASSVAHCFQHWEIYRKWNEKLFAEMYQAYSKGWEHVNPTTFWYEAELRVFDDIIIPLGKKLEECNVFGMSSVLHVSCAISNRSSWYECGKQVVIEMEAKMNAEKGRMR
jgi:hypothetical protein